MFITTSTFQESRCQFIQIYYQVINILLLKWLLAILNSSLRHFSLYSKDLSIFFLIKGDHVSSLHHKFISKYQEPSFPHHSPSNSHLSLSPFPVVPEDNTACVKVTRIDTLVFNELHCAKLYCPIISSLSLAGHLQVLLKDNSVKSKKQKQLVKPPLIGQEEALVSSLDFTWFNLKLLVYYLSLCSSTEFIRSKPDHISKNAKPCNMDECRN